MLKQFIVEEKDKIKREEFYNYIIETYTLKKYYPYKKEAFIKSDFPFVIDFKQKSFWICESITSLALASQAKKIYSVQEFKNLTENDIINYKGESHDYIRRIFKKSDRK